MRRAATALLVVLMLAVVPLSSAREVDLDQPPGLPSAPPAKAPRAPAPQVDEGTQADAARWDAARWDGAQWDGAQWDGAQWDGAQWDASRWDASRWDASRWDADSFSGYDPLYPYQWGLRMVNAPGAWARVGHGTMDPVICVVDSGVDFTHPDLAGRAWSHPRTGAAGHDFVDDDAFPDDVGGHGTHVASIAAARAGDGFGIAGVADARIMAVRVLGPDGTGSDEDLAAGITYCAENGADIVSLSLSTVENVKLVASAVNYATVRGALVVGSAGNHQCESCQSPLVKLKGVLTVTAVGPDGQVAPFTTWGPSVDLAAPGVAIPGAIPGGGFALASGTSQAVPHVAGAAALVWAQNPSFTAGDVADILVRSAQRTGTTPYGDLHVLDVDAAVELAAWWPASGSSPSIDPAPSGGRPAPAGTAHQLGNSAPSVDGDLPPVGPGLTKGAL